MSRRRGAFLGLLLFFVLPTVSSEGALLDRVLAAVDEEIITLTDVRIALQFNLVHLRDPSPDPESPATQKEVLSLLIDRKLLLAEARKFSITPEGLSEAEVSEELGKIRKRFSPEGFPSALNRFGMSEEELIHRVRDKVAEEKFLNFRIGFFVILPPDAVRKYYEEHASEYGERSLESVQGEIEALLSRRESERLREEYLARLRGEAEIRVNE